MGRAKIKRRRGRANDFYKTFSECSKAVIKLGITSWKEYDRRYSEDPKLPSNPNLFYKDFVTKGGMKSIWNTSIKYQTFEECAEAVQKLKIKSWAEYKERCKEDSRLPFDPAMHYEDYHLKGGIRVLFG